jgi:hypothetical protein
MLVLLHEDVVSNALRLVVWSPNSLQDLRFAVKWITTLEITRTAVLLDRGTAIPFLELTTNDRHIASSHCISFLSRNFDRQ